MAEISCPKDVIRKCMLASQAGRIDEGQEWRIKVIIATTHTIWDCRNKQKHTNKLIDPVEVVQRTRATINIMAAYLDARPDEAYL